VPTRRVNNLRKKVLENDEEAVKGRGPSVKFCKASLDRPEIPGHEH